MSTVLMDVNWVNENWVFFHLRERKSIKINEAFSSREKNKIKIEKKYSNWSDVKKSCERQWRQPKM